MNDISIVIPTCNGEKQIARCLAPLIANSLAKNILVIDSSSSDATPSIAREMGVEVVSIPQKDFNHGATREWGRRHKNSRYVAFFTQDAYPTRDTLSHLIVPLQKGKASISYGRQRPHEKADILEAFPREFNYPPHSHIRSMADVADYGFYTFFCSNSCAAYDNAALDSIGGFPTTPFGEDTLVTAHLLQKGYKIAYVAEATVFHSHSYSLREEWKRHRIIGQLHRQHLELFAACGKAERRGSVYIRSLLKTLWKEDLRRLPYGCLQSIVKFLAYKSTCYF